MNRVLQFPRHLPHRIPQNLIIIQNRNMAKAKGGKAGKVKKVRNMQKCIDIKQIL